MTSLQLISKDHVYLETLLHAQQRDTPFSQLLRRKLETAEVVLPELLDSQTATIDSQITFSVGGGSSEHRVLTRQEQDRAPGPAVPLPVTTMRGLALLGLKAGDIFALRTESGIIEPLRLEKVIQPLQWSLGRQKKDKSVVAFPPPTAAMRHPAPTTGPEDDDPGPQAA
jgi:regulator of nucleoside diphosphate kinase